MNGLIIRGGYVVADWGETTRVDMTHSVTKTFLSTVVGLAWQRGLIGISTIVWAPTCRPVPLVLASSSRHTISRSPGTICCGRPATGRARSGTSRTGPIVPKGRRAGGRTRPLHEPGTRYKYNDVRVNLLALATLHVFRRPLPDILREEVMEPIGASTTWRWHGYDNSWIDLDGRRVQSVSGGGHWGGGMFINAWDMARFGYLFLRNGSWKGREIVSPKWIAMARTPGKVNPEYGFMNWYLNTGRKSLPSTPESSVTFRGNGQNIVYVDWENDLVVVVRWIGGDKALDGFLGRVLESIRN